MPKIKLVIFDVNETLFSFDELEKRFKKVGLDPYYCKLWFSNVLKEGFALNSIKKFVPFRVIGENQIIKMLEEKKRVRIHTSGTLPPPTAAFASSVDTLTPLSTGLQSSTHLPRKLL